MSEFNKLEGNRYFDVESQTSFEVDHVNQVCLGPLVMFLVTGVILTRLGSIRCAVVCARVAKCGFDVRYCLPRWSLFTTNEHSKSLLKSLSAHATEHYATSSYGVYPIENDSAVAIVLVANRYSPNNFWYAPSPSSPYLVWILESRDLNSANDNRNGRFRAIYTLPVNEPSTVTGKIQVDVHYYEDGNVALNTAKPVTITIPSLSAETIMGRIGAAERDYQETLNRAFVQMAEEAFKNLRRQLPITRQKVEWEKVGGYRLGQDIGGKR